MLDNIKHKIQNQNKDRHEKLCTAGKHKWFVLSTEELEYDYCSYGSPGPTYTKIVRKCLWCGVEEEETIGELPADYEENSQYY